MASSPTSSFSSGSKPKPIITVLCCHCGLPNQLTLTAEASQGFSCWDCQVPQYVISVDEYESVYLKKHRKSYSFFSKKKPDHSENSHVAISIEDKHAIDSMGSTGPASPDSVPGSTSTQANSQSKSEQGNGLSKSPVKDMTYYNLLQVPHDASPSQIRKQYYLMAMKYHPDKNPDDPEAEAKFKKISEAYQILSDPKLRSRYDALGSQELSPEGGFMNPEDVFKSLFGGDKFVTIIGEISLGRLLSELMVENAAASAEAASAAASTSGAGTTPSSTGAPPPNRPYLTKEKQEEMRLVHEARVVTLLQHLVQKTNYYTEGIYSEPQFREYITKEAVELAKESFGVPLLHSIGYVYSSKAKQRMGKESFLGLSGLMSNLKEKGHIVASLVDTIGAVREVAHDANVEERKEAQRRKVAGNASSPTSASGSATAASFAESSETASGSAVSEEKMKRALWKASSFEVEATLREVCERFLFIKPRELALKRAFALKLIGDVYRSMKE